ncbi:MAG: FtsX-like permease family protein [Anaerolineae bacterium]
MNSVLALMRFAFRNMWSRKIRTVLTIIGIVLGVAVVLAISITNDSTLASIRRIFDEASGRAHLVITSNSVMGDAFDGSVLSQVSKMPGVRQAAPSVSQKALLAADADEWGLSLSIAGTSSANDLLIFGIDPVVDLAVRDYDLVAGSFLGDDRDAYTALLVQDYADEKGLSVGDDLTILTSDNVESFRITGLIRKAGPGLQNNGAVAVVPIGAVQAVFDLGSDLNQIDLLVDPDIAESPRRLEEFKSELARALGRNYQVLYPAARGAVVSKMLASYQLGLSFFSAVALFVGAFLIYNTFTMTVVERTREIGLLRTLGMTRFQVTLLVLAEAFLLGGIGSAAGVGFGLLLSRGLMRSMGAVTATEITQITIPPTGLATALLVGMGVTLASASLPAWRARDISPLEALRVTARPQSTPLGRYGWLVGISLIVAAYLALYRIPFRAEVQYPVGATSVFILLLGATLVVPVTIGVFEWLLRPLLTAIYKGEGRLGASNIRRAKGRTALTVAALMVGIAMIIGIQALTTSFEIDIDNWVQTAVGGDLYVRSPIPMRDEFGRRLQAEPTVAAVSPVTYHRVRRVAPNLDAGEADTLLFVGIDPETYPSVASFVFEDPEADLTTALARLAAGDALLISTTLADRYGLDSGDSLRLETRRGQRDFRVAGVVVDFSSQGYVVHGTRADLERYFGEGNADEFIVALKPGVDPEAEAERLQDRYGKTRHIVVETATDFRTKVSDLTAEAFALFDVLGLIGVIIAALGVVNTLLMNVFERQREIGGLRSLGMTRAQVARMVLAESGAMGMIGGVFGTVFGFFLSQVFLLGLKVLGGYTVHYNLPLAALAISVVIALLVSQGAALYPAWRAATVRIIEAIQHE